MASFSLRLMRIRGSLLVKVAHALLKSWGTRETPLMFVLLGVIMGIGISLGLCLGELAHVDVVLD